MFVYTALFLDLVGHFCHTNDSRYLKIANNGLTQSINCVCGGNAQYVVAIPVN